MKVKLTGAEVAEAVAAYARNRHPRADCNDEFDCSVEGPLSFMVLLGSKTPVVTVELTPRSPSLVFVATQWGKYWHQGQRDGGWVSDLSMAAHYQSRKEAEAAHQVSEVITLEQAHDRLRKAQEAGES